MTIAVGLIDSMMVASVGESAVSAISLVDTVNILIINIFTALATGGAVVAGQYIGMKQSIIPQSSEPKRLYLQHLLHCL